MLCRVASECLQALALDLGCISRFHEAFLPPPQVPILKHLEVATHDQVLDLNEAEAGHPELPVVALQLFKPDSEVLSLAQPLRDFPHDEGLIGPDVLEGRILGKAALKGEFK